MMAVNRQHLGQNGKSDPIYPRPTCASAHETISEKYGRISIGLLAIGVYLKPSRGRPPVWYTLSRL